MPDKGKKIVIFGTEPVTGNIGGLGIRQLEAARLLHRRGFAVRLITPYPVTTHSEPFIVEHRHIFRDPSLADEPLGWADAVYASQPSPVFAQKCAARGVPVVVDLLALLYFEELEHFPVKKMNAAQQAEHFAGRIARITSQMEMGDFFLCASGRERDYYLGILTQLGKLRPDLYHKDPLFNSVIGVAPFGIPAREPKRGEDMFRGKIPGVKKKDFIIVWGGSLWNWYDCLTPVKAMKRLLRTCPRAKLVFAGHRHPATSKPTEAYAEVMRYVTREKLLGKNVFFHADWVPYEKHEYYLTEADAGIATFRDHIENRFSFRIRVADYLWGNLPVLTNPGNTLSGFIEDNGLGHIFPFGDDKALAERIAHMASHPAENKAMRKRIKEAKKAFHWDRALKPLLDFCKHPKKRPSIFSDALPHLSFYELNRAAPKKILFLRSSPMEHSADGFSALRRLYPDAAIDIVLQPNVDAAPFNGAANIIRLGQNGFTDADAQKIKSSYDLLVCCFNTNDLLFYKNVTAFAARIDAKAFWAFNVDYRFVDIKGLFRPG